MPFEISTRYGCVWKWRNLARRDIPGGYLAVGIRFPDIAKHYEPSLVPDGGPFLFVELATEVKGSEVMKKLVMPSYWIGAGDLRLATRSMRDLPTDADLFASEAEGWVSERINEAAKALA